MKAKFGGEIWVFVSAYGPGCEEERERLFGMNCQDVFKKEEGW